MKPAHLLALNLFQPGNCIHVNRDEWTLEQHQPGRKSCVPSWQIRHDLRTLLPGDDHVKIAGVWVKKTMKFHRSLMIVRYRIDGNEAILHTLVIDEQINHWRNCVVVI